MRKIILIPFTVLFLLVSCKMEFDPNSVNAYVITYVTDKGTAPKQIALAEGAELREKHLPVITTNYFALDGWYIGNEKIQPGYAVKSDLTLTAKWNLVGYEFTWTDASKEKQIRSNVRSDLSNDGYYLKATQTKDTGSALNNWTLSYDSQPITEVQGIEARIKFNGQIKNAGLQIYDKTSFDYYWFTIRNDGSLFIKVTYTEKDEEGNKKTVNKNLATVNKDITKIDTSTWNTLKIITTPMQDTEVYINGTLAYTILKDDLKITKDKVLFAHQTTSKASASTPAYAWLELLQFQKIK